jgi:HEAT repeat protein
LTGLTDALADADAGVRINAARALTVAGIARVVAPITRLLNDPDAEVRAEVATLLATTRGRDIVDRLHQLLIEDHRDLRRRIVRVLGEIGEPISLNPVSFFLDDPDKNLVYEAVVALANIGIAGAEQKLADLLLDEANHYTLRMQAARALGKQLGNPSVVQTTRQERAEKMKALEVTREVLEEMVFDPSERVACAALDALVEMEPHNATLQLVKVLEFIPVSTAREFAAGAAQDNAPEDAAEEIPPELADMVVGRDTQTSTLAAILANQPSVEDISSTGDADDIGFKQVQPGVRALAVRLFGNIREPGAEAIKSLIHVCQEGDPGLRREAIHSLGCSADESALDTILDGLAAEQEGVRLAALDALGNFRGADSVGTRLVKMLEDPDPTIRQRVVEQITSLPGAEVSNYLCRALEDDDLGVCRTALNQLSREIYSAEVAQKVENLMFRFSGELSINAAAALRRIEDFSSSSRLLENLMDMEQASNHWVCIDALAEMYSVAGKNGSAGSTASDVRAEGVG